MKQVIDTDSRLNAELAQESREYDEAYRKSRDVQRPLYRKFLRSEIESMRPLSNHVLCVVARKDHKTIDVGGMTMETRYREIEWMPTYLEVLAAPSYFSNARIGDDRHDNDVYVDMEVKKGDRVLCRYLATMKALGWADAKGEVRTFIDEHGVLYVMVPYKDLVCRIDCDDQPELKEEMGLYEGRDYDIHPLNGHVVMSKVDSEDKFDSLFDVRIDKDSMLFGKVEYVGKKVKGHYHDFSPDSGQLIPGDYVGFTKGGRIQLQETGVNIFGRDLFRCPIRHIAMKVQ